MHEARGKPEGDRHTPEQYKIISGRIYNRRKQILGGQVPKGVDQVDPPIDSTAAEVASELGISPGTVKRNGQRAEVHDALLEQGDVEAVLATARRRAELNSALLQLATVDERPAVLRAIRRYSKEAI